MRVELRGGYFAVRDYLKELEEAPWRFSWRSMNYHVDQFPDAVGGARSRNDEPRKDVAGSMSVRAMLSLLTVLVVAGGGERLVGPDAAACELAGEARRCVQRGEPARRSGRRLTSILVSPSRRVAVIDGVSLREGQTANGITVVHIGKTWVDARVQRYAAAPVVERRERD